MSRLRKATLVASCVALILVLAPAATTQAADRGADADAAAAARAADDFEDCCKDLKDNLDTCESLFGGTPPSDPAALALCRDEAFGHFRECVDGIDIAFGVMVFGEAVQAVQACPIQAQLPR